MVGERNLSTNYFLIFVVFIEKVKKSADVIFAFSYFVISRIIICSIKIASADERIWESFYFLYKVLYGNYRIFFSYCACNEIVSDSIITGKT